MPRPVEWWQVRNDYITKNIAVTLKNMGRPGDEATNRVGAKHGLWTLDWTHGLDCGLRFGLDFGVIRSSMTTISNHKVPWRPDIW